MDQNRAGRTPLVPLDWGPPPIVVRSPFPQYAYGMLLAVRAAVALGHAKVYAVELGVAGGNGLVELERLAEELGTTYGVDVATAGFDLVAGMPPPLDYRDAPYSWQGGFFKMDEPALRARLRSAELVLGDIAETGRTFLDRLDAPIGFVSFDLDYYSSTRSAFESLCRGESRCYLPRMLCYFDDTVGPHEELHSEFTGELLAIKEFNEQSSRRKFARIHGLHAKLHPLNDLWIDGMHVMHDFDHPDYNTYIFPQSDRQFPLEA